MEFVRRIYCELNSVETLKQHQSCTNTQQNGPYLAKLQSFILKKWSDIRLSMVTHTQNLCSAFNTSKVHTHTAVNTHPEQWAAIYAAAPGEQLGVRCLAQGHLSRGIEVERARFHQLFYQNPCLWDLFTDFNICIWLFRTVIAHHYLTVHTVWGII